jgi:hypothetical protein
MIMSYSDDFFDLLDSDTRPTRSKTSRKKRIVGKSCDEFPHLVDLKVRILMRVRQISRQKALALLKAKP